MGNIEIIFSRICSTSSRVKRTLRPLTFSRWLLLAASASIALALSLSATQQSGDVTYKASGQSGKASKAAAKASKNLDVVDGVSVVRPEALANGLDSSGGEKPIIIQVGFRKLYEQAHIPGSEYFGPGSEEDARQQLEKRVQPLPRTKLIVLYCGCCPWDHCPNVKPAYNLLRSLGFTNVKVLYIANNFGDDWVNKGYPTARGSEKGNQ